ncbi:MAG: type II toxin-antitoxin system prevent-host-death family antitoxin [Frankiaceae bacterium]|nr:type II toxin-antitoxin system prevent-host-death family antitoxin [Frankiaceae bacterium]
MERIGVREVRQNLSVYLRRVQAGEAFTVTDHGAPVALLSPLPPSDDPLADLIASGRLIPAPNRGGAFPKRAPGPSATAELLAERRSDDR